MPTWDMLLVNGHVATMRAESPDPYGTIRDGCVAVRDGRIAWVGRRVDLPPGEAVERVDMRGGWVTPGLIDCHTHLVFGGDRIREFEQRLLGATYEELARAGGGILSTVRATRAASRDELLAGARARLADLSAAGVTTVEIKSGYGLDVDTELRMLDVGRALGEATGLRVVTTLLGAHALPPEYASRREAYVDLICQEMIPRAAEESLADAVDAFLEEIAFTADECDRVFDAAASMGLPVRLHADQRTDGGGAALAARHGARSADHLEYTSEAGVEALAAAGTVAVLLPGAAYFLRDARVPPVEAFRRHGVPMAVATDLNPGSSPLRSPLMAMNMACTLFRLTPAEALAGMTRTAARVLGLENRVGVVEESFGADLAVWDISHPAALSYWMGGNPCRFVVRVGTLVPGGR